MKKFLTQVFLVLLANLIIKPSWLLTENWLQDRLGHSAFGLFAAIFSLSYLLSPIADLGINQYITKWLANFQQKVPRAFLTIFRYKSYLALVYFLVFLSIGYLLQYWQQTLLTLIFLGLTGICISFLFMVRAYFQALQQFQWEALLSVLDKALLMLIIWFLTPSSIEMYAFWTWTTFFIAVLTGMFFLLRSYRSSSHLFGMKNLLLRSYPFALMMVLYSSNERINQIFIEQLSSSYENGIYVAAFRWISAIAMYLWTVLPLFYARFAHTQQRQALQQLLNTSIIIVGIPVLMVCIFLWGWGDKLFFLFKHSNTQEIQKMTHNLQVLSIGLLANAFLNPFSTYLTSKGYEQLVNRLLLIGVLSNIVLCILLIPLWGALGASTAYSVVLIMMGVGYIGLLHYKTPLKVPYKLILKVFIVILWTLLGLWIVKQYALIWFFAFILTVLWTMIGIYFSGIITLKELKQLLLWKRK